MKYPEVLAGTELLLALARTGSATRTAAELGTTPATVLRRLSALEAALGVRLFHRLATGLEGTAALALARPWAEQARASAAGLLRELSRVEQRPEGVVRLAVPPAVAELFIVPALPGLRAAAPGLVVELAPATAVVDLAAREADLAVRTVRPAKGELVVQRLATYRLGVYGARGLGPARRGSRRLEDYPWLAWDPALAAIPEARWLEQAVPGARVVFRATELGSLLGAARAGLGALAVADRVGLAAGLRALPVDLPPMPEGALWLVAHQALRPVPRVAAVWGWLAGLLAPETG